MIAILLLAIAGCAKDAEPARPAGYWFTEPQDDDQRLEVLRRARGIDPCALVPRAELEKLGAVRSVVNDQPDSCEAGIGSAEYYKGIELDWAVVVATVQKGQKVTEKTVDGLSVMVADERDALPKEQFEKLVERNCTVTGQFPAGAALMLFVSTPLGTEPCPVGESILRTAAAEWVREPQRGTAPETARTVLTSADPCDVLPALGITVNPADRRMRTCDFTYRGGEVSVRYEYEEQDMILGDEPTTLPGSRHPVYKDVSSKGDFHFRTATVGPAINPDEPGLKYGPRYPTVSVTARNPEDAETILTQVLTLFP
ncbi:hypothetical protein JK358_12560 [Nocardia sp. 2]|uniref:DUF3558 domain-containing protein n=1 Tax=Nocardia acididurans TaxID=2802282 RepID=A0ABS1M590_9NOCA|nr:hypothetical protein [Nocardia acididurans]MBL1075225.1 hypothetical protein [Nocardia acididurans]